ncbi:MAG: histidine kinase [Pseudomonadota bacterium]
MKINTGAGETSVADLALLTLIAIPAALGFAFATQAPFFWQWLGTSALLYAMYLAWLARGQRAGADRRKVLLFGLRMQAQALSQFVAFAAMTVFAIALCGLVFGKLDPADALWQRMALPHVLVLAGVLAKLSLVASTCLAWGRFHFFRRTGAKILDLADAGFNRRVIGFPAAPAVVAESLLRHVDRLGHQSAPRYTRMFMESPVTLGTFQADGRSAFSLTWKSSTVRVKLVPLQASNGATDLQVNFELRGGLSRLELFVNPVDVQLLMNFLQAQVFQRMSSELMLSNAVTKQNTLRAQAVESQLRILQAQIEPHFLFNTLANVRHLYRSSVESGEQMMDHLIVYLRSTLEELRSDVSTVGKEMDLILHYLAIMKIRMGDRLSYGFIVADSLSHHHFPPAMLISLVENSIKHGLHDKADGKLTISCERVGDHLRVSVADNGAGFSSVGGTGVGLSNIRQRLEAMHGNRAWLEVGAQADGGFISSVTVPYEGNQ